MSSEFHGTSHIFPKFRGHCCHTNRSHLRQSCLDEDPSRCIRKPRHREASRSQRCNRRRCRTFLLELLCFQNLLRFAFPEKTSLLRELLVELHVFLYPRFHLFRFRGCSCLTLEYFTE